MRIGATLLFKNGMAFQSYGWKLLRPLGNLQNAIHFLENYEVDEISIIRPIRGNDSIVEFKEDLENIKNISTMTPISFGGGIRDLEHVGLFAEIPVERFILTTAFLNIDRCLIGSLTKIYGKQSIMCLLPMRVSNGTIEVYNPKNQEFAKLENQTIDFINTHSNELMVYDVGGEGTPSAFDWSIISNLDYDKAKLIISGGIGPDTAKLARSSGIAAAYVENRILHHEYSVKAYYHG